MLLLMGIFRLGFLANFLSHPVITGFITASAIIIATSQLGGLLGIPMQGHALPELLTSLASHAMELNLYTLAVGLGALGLLLWIRLDLGNRLLRLGLPKGLTTLLVRAGPVLVVSATIFAAALFDLGGKGVALVGEVPQGLPMLSLPSFQLDTIQALLLPALIISIVGFVESISVAQTLAAKRRERIAPDQELIGLGASNIAAAIGGAASTAASTTVTRTNVSPNRSSSPDAIDDFVTLSPLTYVPVALPRSITLNSPSDDRSITA